MKAITRQSWVLLFLVGLGIAYFAYDNLVVIPALDPADPDRGWAWLTTDPKVIEYIKFLFRNFGYWVLAVAVFVTVSSWACSRVRLVSVRRIRRPRSPGPMNKRRRDLTATR